MNSKTLLLLIFACCGFADPVFSQGPPPAVMDKVEKELGKMMKDGHIPGLTLVLIKGDTQLIRSYGYSDVVRKEPVTGNTLFELGSCSKAFTALAAMDLVGEGRLDLDRYVSDYLPWLHFVYRDKPARITVRQLLHHTSGIPWHTISLIPETSDPNALVETVKQLDGQKLNRQPGTRFEYATINYDVLALIIQEVVKQPFEQYLQQHVIDRVGMAHTTIGYARDTALKATGYKIGFFGAREYKAPVFRGNNAAGYVVTDAGDVAKWLRFQMGLDSAGALFGLADSTHQRDQTVPLHGMSSYAMGWDISLSGNGEISHDGQNPNFTSFIAFRPQRGIGIAIMSNSNSSYTAAGGEKIMKLLAGDRIPREFDPGDRNDKTFSVISIVSGGYVLLTLAFLVLIVRDIVRKKRVYEGGGWRKARRAALLLVMLAPFLLGLYLLPRAITNFTWEALIVWSPASLPVALAFILVSVVLSYIIYTVTLFYAEKDGFRRLVPRLVLFSVMSGLANIFLIMLITSALDSDVRLRYMVFYYVLAVSVYLLGRKYVQTTLIRFSRGMTYELRVKMVEKIFSTPYQKFEKLDKGRVFTSLNDDLNTIGESTNLFITLVSCCITAIGAFIYLSTIAFWSTMLTIVLLLFLVALFYFVGRRTNAYFEKARDTQNLFMRLTSGMIEGFKEISLHRRKKLEFMNDMSVCANEFRDKVSTAAISYVNVSIVGESLLIISMGTVAFGFPKIFPGIPTYTIMSFIIILLYMASPISGILSTVPSIMQLKVSIRRVRQFLADIPSNTDLKEVPAPLEAEVRNIRASGVVFQYKNDDGEFGVGPIDLEVSSGEIVFIIGGNGSGKTTLAKLLTGLYEPDEGVIMINDRVVPAARLGEYFSAVFSPLYLFEKTYALDLAGREAEIKKYLQLLKMEDKVRLEENKYSTIQLSGGQRKRLALLQCYLEDSPIYLFDEWAADQDPVYRNFFYRTLLPAMKAAGKIVIAITHDEHYFDAADRIYVMSEGKLDIHTSQHLWSMPSFQD